MPAAFFSSTVAGGVFMMNVKLRSLYTEITTGTGIPASMPWVCALNCLQNSMMFTPCWPSAGPTGGLGFAFAAGTWSLMYVSIFFAIRRYPSFPFCRQFVFGVARPRTGPARRSLSLFHLAEVELDRSRAAQDLDRDADLA